VSLPNSSISATAAAARFPSVCWLFGKRLHARLGRPLGLVSVTYSDSHIDEWLPSRVVDTCADQYTDRSLDTCLLHTLTAYCTRLFTANVASCLYVSPKGRRQTYGSNFVKP